MNEQDNASTAGLPKRPPTAALIRVDMVIGGYLQPVVHKAVVDPGDVVIWKASRGNGFELQFDAFVPGEVSTSDDMLPAEGIATFNAAASDPIVSNIDQVVVLQVPEDSPAGAYYYDLAAPGGGGNPTVQQSQHGVRAYAIIIRPPQITL